MTGFLCALGEPDEAQDIAEYAVILAVIVAIAVATIRLVGSHAGNVFASVGSAIQ
jgi:Flp pilus assembly pilin Flp